MIIKREKEKLAQEFHGHIYSLDKEQSFLFAVFFSGGGGGFERSSCARERVKDK